MRLVATYSVTPGSVLARDVWGSSTVAPLLRAGTVLRDTYLDRLSNSGIAAVYIDDELSAGIDIPTALRSSTQVKATGVLAAAFSELPGAVAVASGPLRSEIVLELRTVVQAILEDLEDAGDAMIAFGDLATVDAYTMQHSIDVTVMGLMLARRLFREYGWIDYDGARRFDRIEERLIRLGLGLLLHDIGKVTVPQEVLNKKGPLDADEWDLIRAYPAAGAGMVTDDSVGARARSVIRFHHERYDGTGYPAGLKGEGIPQLARIAAVADVFDAITSARPYRIAAPIHVAVEEVVAGSRSHFDPEVVAIFRSLVAPHPAGTYVSLSDGREGIVSHVPPTRADRPVVRVVTDFDGTRLGTPLELPLVHHPDIQILNPDWPPDGAEAPEQPRIEIPVGAGAPALAAKASPAPVSRPRPAVAVREPDPPRPARTFNGVDAPAAEEDDDSLHAPNTFSTDLLTGLGTRGKLDEDLTFAVARDAAPSLLVVFDLDGTGLERPKSRVHSEGLLRDLAARLTEALGDAATCYRSREVELSALIYAPERAAIMLAKGAAKALRAHDVEDPPEIKFGFTVLPTEATMPLEAIRLADRRRKYGNPAPSGS